MDGGLTITLISVAMFVGCFILGFIPLLFRLSQTSLKFISILGAGLLCGTALAITIPEGVDLLEDSFSSEDSYSVKSSDPNATKQNTSSTDTGSTSKFLIGLTLTLGFILMFVVDQIGSYLSTRGKTACLSNSTGITATLGLVIHAAADGFALGAAVATTKTTVQIVVFFAVILHKAPAAFGLVSYLMHTGLEKKYIQGHLLAFSAAAPIVAIATYFILHASGSSSESHHSATGVGMLFSAGTFLYVATVHVLPEISSRADGADQPQSDTLQQHSEGQLHHHQRYLGLLESVTLVLGVGIPVVLALGLDDD